jgi:hypothetical protein
MEDSDAALLVTDWEEFNQITRKDLKTMNRSLLLEGRRMDYDIADENKRGITWP